MTLRRRSFVVALAASAVTAARPVHAASARRVLHRSANDEATTLDPQKVGYPGETTLMSDLFVGLTELDAAARVIPGCATRYEVTDDGRTWTFAMRRGLAWSDGTALDARDFEFAIRRALRPATAFPYAGRLYMLRGARAVATGKAPPESLGVRAVDPATLRIELEHPTPFLPEVLATFAMPVPRERVARLGDAWVRGSGFVTNGPFTVAERVPNAYIRLERNRRYHDAARVRLDGVFHYPTPQPGTALRRFAAGEIDLVLTVPPELVESARRQFGTQLRIARALGVEVIAFNTRTGATSDPRVRRALSLAVDREALARNVLGDAALAAFGYVPPGASHYPQGARADFAAWPAARRASEARALLAAAGFGAGKPLVLGLSFPANDANRRIAVVVAAMWKSVGVEGQLQAKEARALVADVASGRFDAVRALWLGGHTDPTGFLERLDGQAAGTTMNQSGYVSAEFDARVRAGEREQDLVRRAALLREAESIALRDHPVAPLYWFVARRLVSSRVRGFDENVRAIHVSRWFDVDPR
jgi:oligopeptide transport system substrate-binding protein